MGAPCKDCGCTQYDEWYMTECHSVLTCKEATQQLEELEQLKLQIEDWRKVLADLALHNCCDEVCFGPCSTKRAAEALKKYEVAEKQKCGHKGKYLDPFTRKIKCMVCSEILPDDALKRKENS